jgi:hypothetical protein
LLPSQELLKIFLCAFHDNVGIFFAIVLISFHFSHEVADILDDPLALRGYFLHVRNFFKEVLILIVVFDLDLFESIILFLYGSSIDVSIAAAKLFFNLYVLEAIVSLHDRVVGKKIKHSDYCL